MTALPQHLQALSLANAVRTKRQALKRRIADGTMLAAVVITDPPPEAMTMAVMDVLIAQRYFGVKRARRLLVVAQVHESTPVGDLTARQRRLLSDLVTWGVS